MSIDTDERRRFLRQLGATALAGLGVGGLSLGAPAEASTNRRSGAGRAGHGSRSVIYRCCANAEACPGPCGDGKVRFRCVRSGCPSFCTQCRRVNPNCYDLTAPSCA